jgi:transposase
LSQALLPQDIVFPWLRPTSAQPTLANGGAVSREFKAGIVAQYLAPGVSVSQIALGNGLNANGIRRWVSETQRAPKASTTTPEFVPVNLPAVPSEFRNISVSDKRYTIRIEIPRAGGVMVVE